MLFTTQIKEMNFIYEIVAICIYDPSHAYNKCTIKVLRKRERERERKGQRISPSQKKNSSIFINHTTIGIPNGSSKFESLERFGSGGHYL